MWNCAATAKTTGFQFVVSRTSSEANAAQKCKHFCIAEPNSEVRAAIKCCKNTLRMPKWR